MRKNCFVQTSVCLLALVMFSACTQRFPGYKKTQDGLYYKFYNHNSAASRPDTSDFLKVDMACYLHDSLYYDWHQSASEVFSQLKAPLFAGDLMEAYSMMCVGDSASFYVKADSIALKYYDQDPGAVGLKADDYFRYEVKLVDFQSEKQFQANIDKMKAQLLDDSKQALADYVATHEINAIPDASGIYIVQTEKGTGRCPLKGEKVELDFRVSLLNGQEVGSTFGSPDKFSFVLGEGFTIQGWEDIVPKMHLGERVTALIPADMAYGEHSVGSIPPYSNLVYDIKLLKITTAAELQAETEKALKALKADSEKAFMDYIKTNDITDYTQSGLFYAKLLTTDGEQAQVGKTAQIKFVATYLDGTPLGDSDQLGDLYDVEVGQGKVLRGLDEGISLMRVGEKARFVLPYTLAYGENPYGNIPAYSNLVFDVELLGLTENK